jgi:hypothetical protein
MCGNDSRIKALIPAATLGTWEKHCGNEEKAK